MSLLDVRNLIVDLPTAAGWIRPVNEVSFHLAPAESLGLVGESGSGKTMLALGADGPDAAGSASGRVCRFEAWRDKRKQLDSVERKSLARGARPRNRHGVSGAD